jgi:hypothetical protein
MLSGLTIKISVRSPLNCLQFITFNLIGKHGFKLRKLGLSYRKAQLVLHKLSCGCKFLEILYPKKHLRTKWHCHLLLDS